MTAKRNSLGTLITLALSMLLSSVGVSIANVALPTLAKEFGVSFPFVQWVIIAYLLLITVMIVNVGRLGDILGRRQVLLAGISLYTLAAIGCGLTSNLWILIIARAIQGTGAAALMALTIALVSESVEEEKIGSAMGLMGAMSAIGTTLGPALGGVLIALAGWRSIFGFMALLGVLNLILASVFLVKTERKEISVRQGFDTRGTVLLAIALTCYSLSMTLGGGHFSAMNFILLVVAALSVSFFFVVEKTAAAPLVPMSILHNRTLRLNLGMNALVSTVMMTTLVVGPFYLSINLGLSAAQVGMVMSVGPICSALSGVPAGHVVDRLSAAKVVLIGLLQMAVGAAALAFLPEHFGLIGYIISVAILSPGYQLFQAANNTAVMAKVDSHQRGVVSGMLSLSRNLGLVTGAAVMGAVFVGTGLQGTFLLALVLVVVTIGLQLISKRQSLVD